MATPVGERLTIHEFSEDPVATVLGIAVIVVSQQLAEMDERDLHILTIQENTRKDITGKVKNVRGVVQETVKLESSGTPESPEDTLWGAMEEIVSPDNIATVGKEFHRVVFSERQIKPINSLEVSMAGGIEVVVFTGNNIQPVRGEVSKPQWMKTANLLSDETIRPTSREAVSYALKNGLLSFGMEQYKQAGTIPVFNDAKSYDAFLRARNRRPDITEGMRQ